MKTSTITKTVALCLFGIGGFSSTATAMQTVGNFSRHAMHQHGRGAMHHMHPTMQLRQNHTGNNHNSGEEESAWLCPIKESDIQTLTKAGPKLGMHALDIKKSVLELHDLLNKTDYIGYNTARNWDDHLHHLFYSINDRYEEIKEQRKAAEAAEEAAMSHVIDAIRISTDHLGHKLHGTSPKPIQTHSMTQTDEDTVTIDLNVKPIEVHEIWKTNNFDWKNVNEITRQRGEIRKSFEGKSQLQEYLLQSIHLIELFLQKESAVFTPRGFCEESVCIQTNINISIDDHLKAGEIFSPKEIQLIQNSRTVLERINENNNMPIEEKTRIVYSDLASGIKDEFIQTLLNIDPPLARHVRSIKDEVIQADKIINKDFMRRDKILTKLVRIARSVWSPYFLELAEKYPDAKLEFDHLSVDVLFIANALEELKATPGSDSWVTTDFAENMRLNFEKNANRLVQMGGIREDLNCFQMTTIVRDLFERYQEENGLRRSKE